MTPLRLAETIRRARDVARAAAQMGDTLRRSVGPSPEAEYYGYEMRAAQRFLDATSQLADDLDALASIERRARATVAALLQRVPPMQRNFNAYEHQPRLGQKHRDFDRPNRHR